MYQRALKDTDSPELCHACHIPDSVQRRLGKAPVARDSHLDDGVSCVACHRTRGDEVAGPFGTTTDAHPTVQHPAFQRRGTIGLCSGCHDTKIGPVLPVARDFRDAGLVEQGKSCVRCHMPSVRRPLAVDPATGQPSGPPRRGRRHTVLGPSDPEFCAKAFEVGARLDRQHVLVSIENRAGHRVPGLEYRKFVFTATQRNADGDEVGSRDIVISAENILKVGETRHFRLTRGKGATMVEIGIVHSVRVPGDQSRTTPLRTISYDL